MFKKVLFIVCFGTVLAVLLTSIQLCMPVYAEEPEPECWAVIVGVSHYASSVCYEDEEGNLVCDGDLKYADDDARDLYELLASIWGEDHIELLLDSEATKVDIYYAIKRLAAKADNDDTVLIYFSGHGLRPEYTAYQEWVGIWDCTIGNWDYITCTTWQTSNMMIWQDRQIVGSGYICPFDSGQPLSWDCDYEIVAADLARWLDMLDSENIVIILDSCSAGSFSSELSQDGRVVLMGCQPDEGSLESCELEHGVFTHYILRAISKFEAADTNGDYEVSAEEIFDYAEPRTVDEIVRPYANEPAIEGRQHPVLYDPHYSRELGLLMKVVFHADAHLPPDTTVLTLDQKPYQSGELPASFTWAAGSVHDVDVPSKVDTEKGTRLVFVSWDDGDASVSRAISHGGEYVANYKTQYQLTIESAYGDPRGEGWYDSGSAATILVIPAEGTIIRQVFTGWSGDFTGTTATASLTMDAPKAIKADWRTEYLRLYILVGGIMALVGAPVGGITYVQRRRKSS